MYVYLNEYLLENFSFIYLSESCFKKYILCGKRLLKGLTILAFIFYFKTVQATPESFLYKTTYTAEALICASNLDNALRFFSNYVTSTLPKNYTLFETEKTTVLLGVSLKYDLKLWHKRLVTHTIPELPFC